MSREGAEALFAMGHSASEHFANFLDFLRMTGTELPMKNSDIADAIAAGLDTYAGDTLTGEDADTIDQLARDMEVIAESLHFAEEP